MMQASKENTSICPSGMKQLFLAVLVVIAFANLVYPVSSEDLQRRAGEMADILQKSTLAYVAVAIAILLAALMYMGSSIFNDARLLAYSKETLYQAIVSLVLIASLPAIYVIISQICIELFLDGMPVNGSMFDVASAYLAWNNVYFFTHLLIITVLNVGIASLINQQYSIPIMGVFATVNLVSFAKPLMFAVGTGVTLLSTSLFINSFQIMLLDLIKNSLLPIFLPLGVVLRAFPPTLNAGNVLLAIAIGAYIIAPAIYAFNIYLVTEIVDPPAGKTSYAEHLGLMSLFYRSNVMRTILTESSCPYVKMGASMFRPSSDYAVFVTPHESFDDNLKDCGIDVGEKGLLDMTADIASRMPTWAKVILGVDLGARSISAVVTGANSVKSLMKQTTWDKLCSGKIAAKICKSLGIIGFVSATISSISTAALAVSLFYYSFDLVVGTAISFVILSAIIPFLNFTILVIFIRDFSQYILGTPISLGHLVRLI
ncbi:MAG: hypothetical protein N3G76_01820 [Candidatus Micrarchaeota archaeon]|nr:hypothetical protein [Candidatus Micrarchaeota archaeon]